MSSLFKLLSFTAVAVTPMLLASCSNDELQDASHGNEIRFTTQISRATTTTTDNLETFKVYAEQLGTGGQFFINGEIAKKNGSVFEFEDKRHYWPSGVNTLRFWAYAPTDVNASITANAQSFDNFSPEAGIDNPGKNQKDLIVAYTEAKQVGDADDPAVATGGTVHLKFKHALSQVSVAAVCDNDDEWVVKVKGAWIVNARKSGTLDFDKSADNQMRWTSYDQEYSVDNVATYGLSLAKETNISNSKANPTFLIGGDNTDNSSLMLVPQKAPAYKFATSDNPTESKGAYILILCRVEVTHEGEFHPGGDASSDFGAVNPVGDKHVHQQFPVTKVWDGDAYGYTCVPIEINWEPTKKYNYVLSFCGKNSGAGVYPPEVLPDGLSEETPRPDDKKPGQPVFNDYIKFEVEVEDWTPTADSNTNM